MVLQSTQNPYKTVKQELLHESFTSWYHRLTPTYRKYLREINCTEGNFDDALDFFKIWVLILLNKQKQAINSIYNLDTGIRAEITEAISDESYNTYFNKEQN